MLMSYVEFDNQDSTYRDINEKVHNLLIADKIHYSKYVEFLDSLQNYNRLLNTFNKLEKRFKTKAVIDSTVTSLIKIEEFIFNFVNKTKNPQAYLLSPYYLYKAGVKYANQPNISKNTGYIKASGSGLDALTLSKKYALFTIGLYSIDKKQEPVVDTRKILYDDYEDIYF